MSQFVPPRPRLVSVKRGFTLVASQFNATYVQGLVTHCTEELRALSPLANVTLHLVPGAFEIPIVVREIALKKDVDAIIALGVIIEGETNHARLLGNVVTNALQQIALDGRFDLPAAALQRGLRHGEARADDERWEILDGRAFAHILPVERPEPIL